MRLTFEEGVAEHIASAYGFTVGDDGYLWKEGTKARATDGRPIQIGDVAAFSEEPNGETAIVRDDFNSLVELVEDNNA